MKKLIFLFVSIVLLVGCQEEIDIKLKSSDYKTVIEAKYSSLAQGIIVTITKNATYFGNDSLKAITGATIKLTIGDTSISLQPIGNGLYASQISPKYLNKTYTLNVQADGQNYQAVSTMPAKVKIDSISVEQSTGIMARASGMSKDSTYNYTVNVYMKDPSGPNYYKIILYKNGERITEDPESSEQIFDDALLKSNTTIKMPLIVKLKGNEIITAELMSIDKASYDYYVSLLTTIMAAGGSFSVPENPITNFNNDALGYFSAYSSDTASAKAPMPKKE